MLTGMTATLDIVVLNINKLLVLFIYLMHLKDFFKGIKV